MQGIPESVKFLLVESGIQLKEPGIPLTIVIWEISQFHL